MTNSIVIINKNDPELDDTLSSLQSVKGLDDAEIIVIDSSDHKLEWIKKKYPEIRWFDFVPKNPKKISIPEQRNEGIKKAKGEIIVFLDASCVPSKKSWLQEITKPIISGSDVIVRGSMANVKNYYTLVDQASNQEKLYVTEAPTINLAIAKSVFKKIGYFDETFSYGSDMDFTWRATHKGLKIRYIESAPVSHNFGDTRQNVKRYINYGKARSKLYFKHPYYFSRIMNYDFQCLVYFLIIILAPIALVFSAYLLVVLGLLLLLIKGKNPRQELSERISFAWGMILGVFN